MANYRQIHVSIWKDDWFLDLNSDEKLFFIYLFSNELASLSGIYKIPLRVMAFETGLDLLIIQDFLDKFQRADKVYYQDGIVWVKNLRKYNKGSSKVDTRIQNDIDEIPYCKLKALYLLYYPENIPYGYHIDTVSYEMKRNEMNGNEFEVEEKGTAIQETPPASFPQTPLEAQNHPDISLFHRVSNVTPGKNHYASVIDAVTILRRKHPDESELEGYLLPFWLAWETRKGKDGKPYSRTNPAWLTDWAVNNDIPKNGSEPVATTNKVNYGELRAAQEANR